MNPKTFRFACLIAAIALAMYAVAAASMPLAIAAVFVAWVGAG